MKVSLVINTLNRRETLRRTLESLAQQRYEDFEVIVVNGPSTDDTAELLAGWPSPLKVAQCPVANLAVSRNIGIGHAAGDIVAFIDDDAIPDPCWLGRIVAGYDQPKIGAVGGFVLDSSGFRFQSTYIVADRFGGAQVHHPSDPTAEFNNPGGFRYAAHLGTNTSVRRSLLLELGGFDEEFEYYLDETDLCLRIVDSGHVVKYVADALVYHKFAASHLRSSAKILVNRYPVLKNQAYFAIKHGAPAHGFLPAIESIVGFVEDHRQQVQYSVDNSLLPPSAVSDFEAAASRAVTHGIERAVARRGSSGRSGLPPAEPATFARYAGRNIAPDRLTLCVLAERDDSAAPTTLATTLADLGHTVHLLSASASISTVDLEHGVWVHRLAATRGPPPIADISVGLWERSHTLLDEVRRIAKNDPIDVIQAASGGCIAAGVLVDGTIPVVASIDKPVPGLASAKPEYLTDPQALRDEVVPALWWERRAAIFADGLLAPSLEAIERFEQIYDLAIDRDRVAVALPSGDCRLAGAHIIGFYHRLIAQGGAGLPRSGATSANSGFSRRCTLAEFWVTAPLFPWLRAIGDGAIDWRLWAYCLALQDLADAGLERALVITDKVLPAVAEYVPHAPVRQLVVAPHANLAAAVASLCAGGGEFDAVYDLALLDPYDDSFGATVTALGSLCRPGAKVHLVLAGGEEEQRLIAIGRELAEVGLVAAAGWTALLGGTPKPGFADPNVEPYLCAAIDGRARPIAAVEFTRVGSSVADAPALAKFGI